MNATLSFRLPEEAAEHLDALNGAAWQAVVWNLDQACRNWLKYGHEIKTADAALEAVREKIRATMDEKGVRFSP